MLALKDDIICTADSFTRNFSDKRNFDYSIKSLEDVEKGTVQKDYSALII